MNLDGIEQLYSDNIDKFGLDAKSVGWGTKEKQYLRFDKLVQVIENPQQAFTLNELGCGYGELVKYFEKHRFNLEAYYGYDISYKMIEAAKLYAGQNGQIRFEQKSAIDRVADYSIASGIFNVKLSNNNDAWETYIKQTLQNMFDFSSKGFSFNLLTQYVDFEAENLYYADPLHYFDYCKKHLSKYVNLIHDYELFEWTIIVKK